MRLLILSLLLLISQVHATPLLVKATRAHQQLTLYWKLPPTLSLTPQAIEVSADGQPIPSTGLTQFTHSPKAHNPYN